MSVKQELICDYCGKIAKGEENHYSLPKGWYLLGYHSQTFLVDDWRATHHFCSRDCLDKAVVIQKRGIE